MQAKQIIVYAMQFQVQQKEHVVYRQFFYLLSDALKLFQRRKTKTLFLVKPKVLRANANARKNIMVCCYTEK